MESTGKTCMTLGLPTDNGDKERRVDLIAARVGEAAVAVHIA